MMLFNEIDNFIKVYNNSVIELAKCFGTSFCGWNDQIPTKELGSKHCIRSITYTIYSTYDEQL